MGSIESKPVEEVAVAEKESLTEDEKILLDEFAHFVLEDANAIGEPPVEELIRMFEEQR